MSFRVTTILIIVIVSMTYALFYLQNRTPPIEQVAQTITITPFEIPTVEPTSTEENGTEVTVSNIPINQETIAFVRNDNLFFINPSSLKSQKILNLTSNDNPHDWNNTYSLSWLPGKEHILVSNGYNLWRVDTGSTAAVDLLKDDSTDSREWSIITELVNVPESNYFSYNNKGLDWRSYEIHTPEGTGRIDLKPHYNQLPKDENRFRPSSQLVGWIDENSLLVYRNGTSGYRGIYELNVSNPEDFEYVLEDFGGTMPSEESISLSPDKKFLFYTKYIEIGTEEDSQFRPFAVVFDVAKQVEYLSPTWLDSDTKQIKWSPSSNGIAYVTYKDEYTRALNYVKITKDSSSQEIEFSGTEEIYVAKQYEVLNYDFSPDGKKIVYTQSKNFQPQVTEQIPSLYLYDLDARQHSLLTENAGSPDWSSANN